jgi:hypothetical protein
LHTISLFFSYFYHIHFISLHDIYLTYLS